MRIDTSAASNPDVLKPILSEPSEPMMDNEPKTEVNPAACKCPECGFTMLIADGCRYCQPKEGRDE